MKVVILNNDFRVYWKGRLHYLHSYLATKDIQFQAIELFGKGSPYDFDTLNDEENWWACLFPENSATQLSKHDIKHRVHAALDKIKPDVVMAPSIVFYAGALGISWAKNNKKKFVMFDDARPSQVKRGTVVQMVKDLITSNADGLWLPANSYDTDYAKFNTKNTLFFYGFNSIDNNLFKPAQPKQALHKTIICVARLVPIKNLNSMLHAWAIVQNANTGYRLTIIGDGPEEAYLKQLKSELQLTSVDMIASVDNPQLPDSLHSADAFILPSLSETWGLVVNEAMAAGLPVLLSNKINAAVDLLDEGVNGFSFAPLDINAMAGTILNFINLTDVDKLQMGDSSLSIIDSMSYEKMGAQLLDALKLINAKPYHRPGLVAGAVIQFWHGRYNTGGWDKL